MSDRDVVFVVGVARSGTSALTRVLSLSGCGLPNDLVRPMALNPKGSWEPVDAIKLNHEFMVRHDTQYGDPSMYLQDLVLPAEECERYIGRIRDFLACCPRDRVLVVKQPHIAEVMAFWLEAAVREGLSPKFVIPIRHPKEVLKSTASFWAGRRPVSDELVNAFWVKLNLLTERHSRRFPRIFVEYPNLLSDWRKEMVRVSSGLSIALKPKETEIEEFLTRDLHRQREAGPVLETFGYAWTRRVYSVLSGAARDEPINVSCMDEIYDAYRAMERAFRVASDEFRGGWKSVGADSASAFE